MTTIVGVHGVGNYRPGETPEQAARSLSTVWSARLARHELGLRAVEIAYYADVLRAQGRQGSDDLSTLPDQAEQLVRLWLNELGLPPGTGQGWGTWPIRQALAWIAEQRKLSARLLELFVATFFREVAAYLREPAMREHARARVVRSLTARRPSVVIGHSLGSVVAYEALWACPEVPVDLFVTLGSPLALPHAVFHRLDPAPLDERGAKPPGVARWINLADPGDLVALPAGGISRRFDDVDGDEHDVVHAFDFHLVSNYLKCKKLGDELRSVGAPPDALTAEPGERF
ncbi:serine peptidase [Lentzea sp. BCCO 10_0061]|uniref:Serine peptidase n=1 Tax=Lentzea sokolovensis TaxID=3095429 RepID=A0ABU4V567_9PSEU|nr:serine peptidase [Lentzea sp. BCCO 10_0061]MDX8146932.1 serine peptidase [Lentzea sp. BCCO 10_0061]